MRASFSFFIIWLLTAAAALSQPSIELLRLPADKVNNAPYYGESHPLPGLLIEAAVNGRLTALSNSWSKKKYTPRILTKSELIERLKIETIVFDQSGLFYDEYEGVFDQSSTLTPMLHLPTAYTLGITRLHQQTAGRTHILFLDVYAPDYYADSLKYIASFGINDCIKVLQGNPLALWYNMNLYPNSHSTMLFSDVFSIGYDYQNNLTETNNWLFETLKIGKLVAYRHQPDGLDKALPDFDLVKPAYLGVGAWQKSRPFPKLNYWQTEEIHCFDGNKKYLYSIPYKNLKKAARPLWMSSSEHKTINFAKALDKGFFDAEPVGVYPANLQETEKLNVKKSESSFVQYIWKDVDLQEPYNYSFNIAGKEMVSMLLKAAIDRKLLPYDNDSLEQYTTYQKFTDGLKTMIVKWEKNPGQNLPDTVVIADARLTIKKALYFDKPTGRRRSKTISLTISYPEREPNIYTRLTSFKFEDVSRILSNNIETVYEAKDGTTRTYLQDLQEGHYISLMQRTSPVILQP